MVGEEECQFGGGILLEGKGQNRGGFEVRIGGGEETILLRGKMGGSKRDMRGKKSSNQQQRPGRDWRIQ